MRKRAVTVWTAVSMAVLMVLSIWITPFSAMEVKAAETYISEVKAAYGSTYSEARGKLDGYQIIQSVGSLMDMNDGIPSGAVVYLGYKTTTDPSQAITGLLFREGNNGAEMSFQDRKYMIESGKTDFNQLLKTEDETKNMKKIYLYYTKEKNKTGATEYITGLSSVINTDRHTQRGFDDGDYKVVRSSSTLRPMDVNAGIDPPRPIWVTYKSKLAEVSEYQKYGTDELRDTVKAINGISYYDTGIALDNADALLQALTAQHGGSSIIESWAQVMYAMLGAREKDYGWRLHVADTFEETFGEGKGVDLVSALTTGTGTFKTEVPRMAVQSSGVKTAQSLNEVYKELTGMVAEVPSEDETSYEQKDIAENVVHQPFLQDNKKQDVVYTLCRVADDYGATGHRDAVTLFGMAFYNFNLVPLVSSETESFLNYGDVVDEQQGENLHLTVQRNNTSNTASGSTGYSDQLTTSTTNSHDKTWGFNLGLSEQISYGSSVGVEVKLLTAGFHADITLAANQAFSFNETTGTSESISQTQVSDSSLSYTLPPYSMAVVKQSASDVEFTQQYDCPVALTYDVAFFSSGADLGSSTFAYTDYAYVSNYLATFGNNSSLSAVDVLKELNQSGGKSNGFHVECKGQQTLDSYTTGDWDNILNKNVISIDSADVMPEVVKRLTGNQPMTYFGGKLLTDAHIVTYSLDNAYALYPIDKIKVFKNMTASGNQKLVNEIDLSGSCDYILNNYYDSIVAYDKNNSEWMNWVATAGQWVIVSEETVTDENGKTSTKEKLLPITETPVSDGIISAYTDSKSGNLHIHPLKDGKSYVRYIIEEDYHAYYADSTNTSLDYHEDELKYSTNDGISAKGTIEVGVSNIVHKYDENGVCSVCGDVKKVFEEDKDGRFKIGSYEDLVKLADMVQKNYETYGSADYVLTGNIFADASSKWTQGIGSVSGNKPFNGKFDGAGYLISGLNITAANGQAEYGGLFEYIGEKGSVKNLHLLDVNYGKGIKNAGSFAAVNEGTISSCVNGLAVNTGVIYWGDKTFDLAQLNSRIEGTETAGGIAAKNSGTIQECRTSARVITEGTAGGVAAVNEGTIQDTSNGGAAGDDYGKLAGGIAGENTGTIKGSYNSGKTFSRQSANKGSVAGKNSGSVSDCFYMEGTGNASGAESASEAKAEMLPQQDMQSDLFKDRLNQASAGRAAWTRGGLVNNGFPYIAMDCLTQRTLKLDGGMQVSGRMHPAMQLSAEALQKGSSYEALTEAGAKENLYSLVIKDGEGNVMLPEYWHTGKIKVTMPNPYGNKQVSVVALNEDGQAVQLQDAEIKKNQISFRMDGLSEFALIGEKTDGAVPGGNTGGEPKTGDSANILIPLALLLVSGGVIATVTVRRRKGRKIS